MNKSGSKTFPVLNPLCRVPHFFVFIQNTRDLCFLQQKDFFRFYKINIRGSTGNKMGYLSGVILFIHSRPGTKRAKQAAPPGSQAPAPKWQQGTNHSMPESNLNLILHPAPRQFRIPLPIQRKRGPGACPPPPGGLQKKKESPGFPLLQKVQTAPEFAQK